MNGIKKSRTHGGRIAVAACCLLASAGIAAAQEGYIDFGIGGVAGYNGFDDIVATSMLQDETTADGLVLQSEDGSFATLDLNIHVGPRGVVEGTIDAIVGDGDPGTDDEVTYAVPVAGRTQYRSRTLISPVPEETTTTKATAETVSTTFYDNAFAIVARRAESNAESTVRLRLAGRERYTESSNPSAAVYAGGFRTVMGLELPDGRVFVGTALVDGLGKAQANFLTAEESFHAINAGGTRWIGDAQVNTTWQDTYVAGGLTTLALMTRALPEGHGGSGGPGSGVKQAPAASTEPGTGRYNLTQNNAGYRGRVTGQIVLPVVAEGVELPAPIELERIPRSLAFSTPSAITTVQHVRALPSVPGGGGKH